MQLFSDINTAFCINLLSIVMIDLVLAGDNSIVIAMAVQSLPKDKRKKGILFGSLAAVFLRVMFTFFASKLLLIPLVKLVGGGLILWIAINLLSDHEQQTRGKKDVKSLWQAVWIIVIADFTMSLDNILAVAGASHGSLELLLFGLGLSIPLVIFASTLISRLMERYPVIVLIGALILGKVAGEMMATDPLIISWIFAPMGLTELKGVIPTLKHIPVLLAELVGAVVVLACYLIQRKKLSTEKEVSARI